MPDAARIAQAQALEIPVTIQGAKSADETGKRELFTESAKTTLVFDNGAVLNLRTRVTPGQSLFVRNDQSGQEILCRVLEAPAEGESGYTDLEFMETAPDFWEGDPEETQAAEEKPEAVVEKSGTQTAAELPEPAAAKSEAETAAEKPAQVAGALAPAAPPELTVAPGAAPAHEGTEAAADNSLAMMGSTASELKLPPAQCPIWIRHCRLRRRPKKKHPAVLAARSLSPCTRWFRKLLLRQRRPSQPVNRLTRLFEQWWPCRQTRTTMPRSRPMQRTKRISPR